MLKTIFIAGGAGYVGSKLVELALKKKYKVICQTRRKLKRNISSKIEDVSFQEINFLNTGPFIFFPIMNSKKN